MNSPADLEKKALAIALDAVERQESSPVARKAVPAAEPETEWHRVHLRRILTQPVAVYDPLGEVEVVLDALGVLWSLDDPRHEPKSEAIHVNEVQAIAAVAELMGTSPKELDLSGETVRTREGKAFIRVKNREARGPAFESKFFQVQEEEEPEGPPPDRVEADVNADTGQVFRFRRDPAPPRPPKPKGKNKA
jgi:hypothetical protein